MKAPLYLGSGTVHERELYNKKTYFWDFSLVLFSIPTLGIVIGWLLHIYPSCPLAVIDNRDWWGRYIKPWQYWISWSLRICGSVGLLPTKTPSGPLWRMVWSSWAPQSSLALSLWQIHVALRVLSFSFWKFVWSARIDSAQSYRHAALTRVFFFWKFARVFVFRQAACLGAVVGPSRSAEGLANPMVRHFSILQLFAGLLASLPLGCRCRL